jgi:hypothetical protein
MAIWYILVPFGIFYGYLLYLRLFGIFFLFWYVVPCKNLATLLQIIKSKECRWTFFSSAAHIFDDFLSQRFHFQMESPFNAINLFGALTRWPDWRRLCSLLRMSWWKICPKCSPIRVLSKIRHILYCKKTAQSKPPPNRRKFAQSGHPVVRVFSSLAIFALHRPAVGRA